MAARVVPARQRVSEAAARAVAAKMVMARSRRGRCDGGKVVAATVVVVRGERHQWRCGGPISLLADQAREECRVAREVF